MESKIKNIEFLRICLIICILIFHLFQKVNLGIYFPTMCNNTHFADKAVEMFFIISGFLLLYTFNEKITVFEFVIKKVIRFTPIIAFMGLCYYLLSLSNKITFKTYDFIFDLFFINNIGVTLTPSNVAGSWFISVLVFVSLFYFYILKSFERKHANIIIGLFTYFSFVLLVNLTHGTLGGHIRIYNNFLNAGILRGLSCIGLGYFLCCIYNCIHPLIKEKTYTFSTKLILTAIEIYLFIFTFDSLLCHQLKYNNKLILLLSFSGLFLLFIINKGLFSEFVSSNINRWGGTFQILSFFIHKPSVYI